MNLEQVEIHNAVPVYNDSQGGWELPRYPRTVREKINTHARTISGRTTGVEVRFVTDAPQFCITLGNLGGAASVMVRKGAFWVNRYPVGPGETQRILVGNPDSLKGVRRESLDSGGWSSDGPSGLPRGRKSPACAGWPMDPRSPTRMRRDTRWWPPNCFPPMS